MSIGNAGKYIKQLRKQKKITQERLSEGICAPYKLSQIENGKLGVSSALFSVLISRMGAREGAFPSFMDDTEFECFLKLKHTRLYFKNFQLEKAYRELKMVEKCEWANCKYIYAEWAFLYAKLQFFSGRCDHIQNYEFLLQELNIVNSNLCFGNENGQLLSAGEIESSILVAEEMLYLGKVEELVKVLNAIKNFIKCSEINLMDKEELLTKVAIVQCKYYLFKNEYQNALDVLNLHFHNAAVNSMDESLYRLNFLKGYTLYLLNNEEGIGIMKTVLCATKAMGGQYAMFCKHKLQNVELLEELFAEYELKEFKIPTEEYKNPPARLGDGIYNVKTKKTLSIGGIIHKYRIEQGLSLAELSLGLCSESKLSKIEHDLLQPDIFLSEILLQRLGISERIFTFWGSKLENELFNYKFQTIHSVQLEPQRAAWLLKKYKEVAPENNVLHKQFILLRSAKFCAEIEEKIDMLFQAIFCTIPDFDISRICDYRLSWAELSALNNIAHLYIQTDTPSKSIHFMNQLMSYYKKTDMDVIYQESVYIPMLEMYCHVLYNQKYYKDIQYTFDISQFEILKCSSNFYAFFLFYYSQAMGECEKYDEALLFGEASYALSMMNGLEANAEALKKYLRQDFDLQLRL